MARRLDGKVAIITGASRGLGEYCAVGYAREGASVVIAARTEEVKDPQLPGTIYDTARAVEEVGAIDTPGLRYGRVPGQVGGGNFGRNLPSPDSYVEAAVLLGMQTVESCTGEVFNDAEAVDRFADDATKRRLAPAPG